MTDQVLVPRELLDRIYFWLERAQERSSTDVQEYIDLDALLAQPASEPKPIDIATLNERARKVMEEYELNPVGILHENSAALFKSLDV